MSNSATSSFYALKSLQTYTHTAKGSKFIAYARNISSVETAESYLKELKQEHPKARHHCYAYRLGEQGENSRINDDGEPSGTAGLPIYNQIQSFELSNTIVVVVRYFGGTLLGVSGLIKAYKEATHGALLNAPTRRLIPARTLSLNIDYPHVNALMQIIERHRLLIVHQEMGMQCHYRLRYPLSLKAQLEQELNAIESLSLLNSD